MAKDISQNPKSKSPAPHPPSPETVENTEKDPAVERGERIDTGKQIARGGKSQGKVPGTQK